MTPRWIGKNTIMLGHTAVVSGGFDLVLIDTTRHTMTHRLKRPNRLIDTVVIRDVVYMAESWSRTSASIVAYDMTTNTIIQEFVFPNLALNLATADGQELYMSVGGKRNPTQLCNTDLGSIQRMNLGTGKREHIGDIRLPQYPNGLTIPSASTVLALEICSDDDHASLISFDTIHKTEAARTLIPRHVVMTMSSVTPQGEVAVFYEDGRIHWYDAQTLDARGHTEIPVTWVSSMMLYPTEAKVR